MGLERDFSRNEWVRLRPRAKDLEGLAEGNGSVRIAMRVRGRWENAIRPILLWERLGKGLKEKSGRIFGRVYCVV